MERKISGVCPPNPRFLTSSALQSNLSTDAFLIWTSASIFFPPQSVFFVFFSNLASFVSTNAPHSSNTCTSSCMSNHHIWYRTCHGGARLHEACDYGFSTAMRGNKSTPLCLQPDSLELWFCTEQKKIKKNVQQNYQVQIERGGQRGGRKKSLDDLNTIIYGPIHSDDVVIWAVIMIVIIIVDEKDFYLGFM